MAGRLRLYIGEHNREKYIIEMFKHIIKLFVKSLPGLAKSKNDQNKGKKGLLLKQILGPQKIICQRLTPQIKDRFVILRSTGTTAKVVGIHEGNVSSLSA